MFLGEGESIHEIFGSMVREDRDRVAIVSGAEQVTYGELDERANRLAARLVTAGVGPDTLVGLCADRSVELIVGMLGILKAGGAYVPIDPDYPAQRIEYLLKDSGVSTLVTVSRLRPPSASARIVLVDNVDDEDPTTATTQPVHRANLAYVIYTSGSTGQPKGVQVEHGNVIRLLDQTQHWFGFTHSDVWTLFHSASFDFSVWEIWGALLTGGRLVIVPAELRRTPARFLTLLRDEGVTVLNQTPSAFRPLIAAELAGPPSGLNLRYVIFGGERLDIGMLAPWIDRHGDDHPRLINMYGITETTVHVTYRRITRADLDRPQDSPIGLPIPDLFVRIVDDSGAPVSNGAPGELEVGGAGVARGYLNRPELNAARFFTTEDGMRWYRSGDRAMRKPEGELVYLGRADGQIKVRGYRIEPGEIEICLAAHPAVSTAIVTSRDFGDGDVRIVAYAVPVPGSTVDDSVLIAELGDLAASRLPSHMRPSAIHVVADVPLTPQGKADLAALWDGLETAAPAAGAGGGDIAATLLRIASEILQNPRLRSEDDLFDAGATSLAFVRIIASTNEHFGVALTGAELGDDASVATLAGCVEAELNSQTIGVTQ